MWIVTVRPHWVESREYVLKPGKTVVGRGPECDILLPEWSVSRVHAEFVYDPYADSVTISDLHSTYGTFVNHNRIYKPFSLGPNDEIRIGQYCLTLAHHTVKPNDTRATPTTRPITQELLIQSLDHHASLLYEVANRLNTLTDVEEALHRLAELIARPLEADKCEVILAERLAELGPLEIPAPVARLAIDQRSAVVIPDTTRWSEAATSIGKPFTRFHSIMCVPVLSQEGVLALIFLARLAPNTRPFSEPDLYLVVAISHQAALTIQRTRMLDQVQEEQHLRELLERYVPVPEAEHLVREYHQSGHLPALREQTLTILFADLRQATRLAKQVGEARFSETLDRLFDQITLAVFSHSGLLNKFVGDGCLAVFGAGQAKADSEGRAVAAALDILVRLEVLSHALGEPMQIGIGISTGPALAGYLGSEQRVEYAALGDAVDVARLLESYARANQILIDSTTCQAVQNRFQLHSLDPLKIRDRQQPVEVYEVLPSAAPEADRPAERVAPGHPPVRLFIADDSAIVRERLVGMLTDIEGIVIVGQAQNAPEAIRAIRRLQPTAVILDIRMPGGSGIHVLEQVKRGAAPPAVIMLTNYPYSQYRQKCLAAGADFFLDKSAEFDTVPRVIQSLYHNFQVKTPESTPGSGIAKA